MNLWIALFRGINVGGRNILPMKDLKSMLEEMGCEHVSTYIQSGNVVFAYREASSTVLQSRICRAVNAELGFEPYVLLLSPDQLEAAITLNPFPDATRSPKTLHLYFLLTDADEVDWPAMDSVKSITEEYRLIDRVFYLHAPDGIGRSRLAAKVEKCLGVTATSRNWSTVEKVLQLARDNAALPGKRSASDGRPESAK